MAIKRRPVADLVKEEQPKQEPIKQEPDVKGSKQVNVEVGKKLDERVTIDFMGDQFAQDHASKKTKEHTEAPKSSIPLDKKVSEIREEIKTSEAKRSGDQFTFKDILQIATFIINAIDGGFGILLNFIARDNRVSVYTLPAETKRQLSDQLALILVKYQVKFKIEFLFLITLILAYMGPVAGAIKHRKSVADGTGGPAHAKGKQKKAEVETKEEPKKEPPKDGTKDATSEPKVETKTVEVPVNDNVESFRQKPPRNTPRRYSRKRATL